MTTSLIQGSNRPNSYIKCSNITGFNGNFVNLISSNITCNTLNANIITGASLSFSDLSLNNLSAINITGTNNKLTNVNSDNVDSININCINITGTNAYFNDVTITDNLVVPQSIQAHTGSFDLLSAMSFISTNNTLANINATGGNINFLSFNTATGTILNSTTINSTTSNSTNILNNNINSTGTHTEFLQFTLATGSIMNTNTVNTVFLNGNVCNLSNITSNSINATGINCSTGTFTYLKLDDTYYLSRDINNSCLITFTTGTASNNSQINYNRGGDSMNFNIGGNTLITLSTGVVQLYSNIQPKTTNNVDLGTSSRVFNTLYINNISGATSMNVGNLTATNITTTNLTGTKAYITTISGADITTTNITGFSSTFINSLGANLSYSNITGGGIGAIGGMTTPLITVNTITNNNIGSTGATISFITGTTIKNSNLTSTNSVITTLTGTNVYIASLAITGTSPQLFLATGGTNLDWYETKTYSSTVSGIWAAAQSCSINIAKIGKVVTLDFPQVTATSNSSNFISFDTTLDAKFRPSRDLVWNSPVIENNTAVEGFFYINTSGAIRWYKFGFVNFGSGLVSTGFYPSSTSYTTM